MKAPSWILSVGALVLLVLLGPVACQLVPTTSSAALIPSGQNSAINVNRPAAAKNGAASAPPSGQTVIWGEVPKQCT